MLLEAFSNLGPIVKALQVVDVLLLMFVNRWISESRHTSYSAGPLCRLSTQSGIILYRCLSFSKRNNISTFLCFFLRLLLLLKLERFCSLIISFVPDKYIYAGSQNEIMKMHNSIVAFCLMLPPPPSLTPPSHPHFRLRRSIPYLALTLTHNRTEV